MNLTSLYRTYRPTAWKEVIGQDAIVATLENELKNNAVAHAFLFTGPRGVGKTTSARLIARALNCLNRKEGVADPCSSCDSCDQSREGRSLDVLEIDAASHTGVDHVREHVIDASRIAPIERANKVFIIDEVHMLSTSAFNALLKTLEEPPKNVYFILATTEAHKVPETIISRCQRFDFRRVGREAIVKRLTMIAKTEGVAIDDDVLVDISRYASGGMRDAESMLGQILGLGKKKITAEDAALILPRGDRARAHQLLTQCLAHDAEGAIATVHDALATGVDPARCAQDCVDVLRASLLATVGAHARDDETIDASQETFTTLLRLFTEAATSAKRMEPPELALELVIVEYCAVAVAQEPIDKMPAIEMVESAMAPEPAQEPSPVLSKEEPVKEGTAEAVIAPLSGVLELAVIKQKWNDLLEVARKYNHSLALIFKVAEPVAVRDRQVVLGFTHSFHIDRLREHANQDIACRVFEEVHGVSVQQIAGEIHTPSAQVTPPQKADALTSTILDTFGGSVVQKG